MPSLQALARAHTELGVDDVEWLTLLLADWQIIADLSFADLVLWLPAADGAGYWAGAQMRPTTGPTALVDDMLVTDVSLFGPEVRVVRAPLMKLADSLGVRKCTNIVALGALAQLTGLLTLEQMTQAVLARAPGKPEINRQAVKLGYEATLAPVETAAAA